MDVALLTITTPYYRVPLFFSSRMENPDFATYVDGYDGYAADGLVDDDDI